MHRLGMEFVRHHYNYDTVDNQGQHSTFNFMSSATGRSTATGRLTSATVTVLRPLWLVTFVSAEMMCLRSQPPTCWYLVVVLSACNIVVYRASTDNLVAVLSTCTARQNCMLSHWWKCKCTLCSAMMCKSTRRSRPHKAQA